MSTEIYLLREYEVQLEKKLINGDHWMPATAPWNLAAEINSCGFALQNNMKRICFDFNSTSVEERPSEWLPWYTDMYRDVLRRYVRSSGRSFTDIRVRGEGSTYDSIEDRLISGKQDFKFQGGHDEAKDHPFFAEASEFVSPDLPAETAQYIYSKDPHGAGNNYTGIAYQGTYKDNDNNDVDFWWIDPFAAFKFEDPRDETFQQNIEEAWTRLEAYGNPTLARMVGLSHGSPLREDWHLIRDIAKDIAQHYQDVPNNMKNTYHNLDLDTPKFKSFPRSWYALRSIFQTEVNPFSEYVEGVNADGEVVDHKRLIIDGTFMDVAVTNAEGVVTGLAYGEGEKLLNYYSDWYMCVVEGKIFEMPQAPGFFARAYNNGDREFDMTQRERIADYQIGTTNGSRQKLVLQETVNLAPLQQVNRGDNANPLFADGNLIYTVHFILAKQLRVQDNLDYEGEDRHLRELLFELNMVDTLGNINNGWRKMATRYAAMDELFHEIGEQDDADADTAPVFQLVDNAKAHMRFFEPLVVGIGRPGYCGNSIFESRGDVIPTVDRMKVSVHWEDHLSERHFNTFGMRNYYDPQTHQKYDFRLRIEKA